MSKRDKKLEPFKRKEPITRERSGRTFYLMKTPLEGYTEKKAVEFSRQLIEKYGFKDVFVDPVEGYYYVYADPGITVEELQKEITKFTQVENAQPIFDKLAWGTLTEMETEKWFHVQCRHCSYQWKTQSKMNLVTCPSCGFKTPRNLPGGGLLVEDR